jgi:hypothetical protein
VGRITALSGLSATRLKHSPRDVRGGWHRETRSCALFWGEQRLVGEWEGGLFAADAGAGEETTQARSVLALPLNEKFLALEVAGVFQ